MIFGSGGLLLPLEAAGRVETRSSIPKVSGRVLFDDGQPTTVVALGLVPGIRYARSDRSGAETTHAHQIL